MAGLIWIGIALLLAAAEVASLAFVCVMFAVGALAAALCAAAGLSVPIQVIVAAVISIVLLTFVRRSMLARWNPSKPSTIGVAGDIGRIAVVIETVTEYDGRIKLPGDAIWSARLASPLDAPSSPGEPVQVVRIDGATAIVARPRLESSP